MKLRQTPLVAALALSALPASAVTLSQDGKGQALIFPYYTVRSSPGGNAFNTYLSVGNSTSEAKALRVRVREGRAGREVLGFNLYLSPNDVWTAAVVPTAAGASLVTADSSCTDPPVAPQLAFHPNGFTGTNADALGGTLDRTREGYVEILEMATLTGQSRANVIHNAAGMVPGCAAMRADASPSVAAPSGGLWGTLTLINVNNGQDFMLDATALDRLATRPYFRPHTDAYPDFDAAEIDPASVVVRGSRVYRAAWSRPVDAVSAVLMRSEWMAEYVLDNVTASLTDLVVMSPTRRFYLGAPAAPPFSGAASCGALLPGRTGTRVGVTFYNRAERGAVATTDLGPGIPPQSAPLLCSDVAVATPYNGAAHLAALSSLERTALFGSTIQGLWRGQIPLMPGIAHGWVRMAPEPTQGFEPSLASLPESVVVDMATGATVTGAQVYRGLPVIGFSARTFANGTLACTTGACQGNYGGAFPFKYRRSISP